MELIITKKNGAKHTILYDDCDHELVSKYTWNVTGNGYATTKARVGGKLKTVLMHRLILGLTEYHQKTDHIHHNKLDNRRSEIRACDNSENGKNRNGYGKSKYLGVYFYYTSCKNKYGPYIRAHINVNGKVVYLGLFKTEIEAAKAYDAAAKIHHGEFANLNFK